MGKIIDIIENNKFLYLVFSLFIFALVTVILLFGVHVTIPRILLVTITTILFALYSRIMGVLVGALSMVILAISFKRLGADEFALSMQQIMTVGIFINAIVSYTIGTLKISYLKNRSILKIVENSKAQYQKVVDHITEGMLVINREGYISFMNKSMAIILGKSVKDVYFHISVVPMNNDELNIEEQLKPCEQGKTVKISFDYMHPDNEVRRLELISNPYIDEHGIYEGSLGFINDVTEMRDLESRYEHERTKNEKIIQEMDHRLGNTLTLIRAYLNIYLADQNLDKNQSFVKVELIIQVIMILYREFYTNIDTPIVSLKSLILRTADILKERYPVGTLQIECNLSDIFLEPEKATPFIMLVTILSSHIIDQEMDIYSNHDKLFLGLAKNETGAELRFKLETEQDSEMSNILESSSALEEISTALLHQFNGNLSHNNRNQLLLSY